MISRVIKDFKKYYKYSLYAAKAELKSDVANSRLNWLWWILDPMLFMMVYSFISIVVFGKSIKYFAAFIFIGLSIWNFFNKSVMNSVKIVSSNKAIITKVYIPKFVLILIEMLEQGFKMVISFALVFVLMLLYRVPLSLNLAYMFPVMLILFVFTFGACCFVAHLGVFVEDLKNVLNALLRLVFYLTGIFYEIIPLNGDGSRIREPFATILSEWNPIAVLINASRQCMLYATAPSEKLLGIWFAISVVLTVVSLKLIYKYENSYVKVI